MISSQDKINQIEFCISIAKAYLVLRAGEKPQARVARGMEGLAFTENDELVRFKTGGKVERLQINLP